MNEITIYNADGTPLMSNVPVTADAVHEENLMQTDQVNLKWNTAGGEAQGNPNLLKFTYDFTPLRKGDYRLDNSTAYYKTQGTIDEILTNDCIRLVYDGIGEAFSLPLETVGGIAAGESITISFVARGHISDGVKFSFLLMGAQAGMGSRWQTISMPTMSMSETEWRYFSMSFIVQANTFPYSQLWLFYNGYADGDGCWIELKKASVKLERGTVATPWRPAESEYIPELTSIATLPAGSFVVLNRIRYYLAEDYRPDSKDLGLYTYTPEFLHEVYLLKKMPFLLIDATNNANSIESDWNYTGSLADLCQPLEQAINDALGIDGASQDAYSVQIDSAIENAVSLSFSNMSILDALNAIAEAVNGEWYTDEAINGYTGNHIIHIAPSCLHEGGESSTLAFTAGNQVGFPQSQQKHEFYNRYYIFGATRNIPQDYNGAQANTVVNKRLTLDPTLHPNGYIDLPQFTEEGEVVTTDDSTKPSFYDENGNVAHYVPDDSLSGRKFVKVVQIDDVYPRANLHVSSIVANTRYVLQDGNKVQTGTDGGGNPVYSTYVVYYVSLQNESSEAFTIDDSTYDPTSNPNGNMIKGLKLSLHFKSGALTGREFEATYHKAASQKENIDGTKVNIPAGCFEIVKIEDNTVIIPNTNIAPVVDDEVTVFNIRMPQAYITSAYKELDKEAMKAIYEEWRDGNEYEVKSNPESFTQNVYNLHIGRHVKLTAWGRLIDTRITKLQTHLDRDFEQTISFTKGIKKGTISTLLTTIEATSARMTQVELKDDSNLHQLRQQLYTAQRELHDMVFDTEGNYYSDKISPVAIETKLIEVGGKSTQLSVSGLTVMPNVNSALTAKDPDHVKVISNSGKLVHYGLPESPRTWNISNNEIDLDNANAYYIYARCVRAEGATACAIVCDQTQYVYNEDETYYYFLIGTISSKISNGNTPPSYDRVVSLMYGSTSISGRFVTTGRIQSLDGNTWFDLDTGELRGNFTFTAAQKEELAADAASRVQVGGKNLVRETYSGNIYTPKTVTLTTAIAFPFVTSHPSSNKGFTVSTDTQYTLSFWIKTDGNITKLTINIWDTAKIAKTINNVMPVDGSFTADTWQKVVCTFYPSQTVSNNGIMVKGEVASGDTDTHTYYVKEIKLEKGTIATDWTAAPEDVDEGIAAAQAAADAAIADLDMYASDSYISPSEKTSLAQQKNDIVAEYTQTIADAQKYGISYTAYTTAYNNAKDAFDYFLDSATWENHISIASGTTGATYYAYFEAYYNARTTLQNSIAEAIKQITSEVLGRNILHGSRSFEFSTASSWKLGTWRASGGGSGTRTRILASDSSYPTNTPVATDVWQIGATTASTGETSVCQQLITAMEVGEKYTLSCYARAISGSPLLYIQLNGGANGGQTIKPSITTEWVRYSLTVTHTTAQANAGGGVIYVGHYSSIGVLQICGLKLEKGTKATDWCPNDADTDYLTSALAEASATFNSTTINGGLVLSKFIGVRDSSNNVVAGMHGTGANMPMIFAGVSSSNAQGTFRVWKDGLIESVSSDQNYKVQLDDSSFVFLVKNGSDYDIRNVIKSILATSISGMLSDSNLADGSGSITAKSSGQIIRTKQMSVYYGVGGADGSHYYNVAPLAYEAIDETVSIPLVSANQFANIARINISSFTVNVAVTNTTYLSPTPSTGQWFSVTKTGTFSGTLTVKLNNSVYYTKNVTTGTSVTIPAGSFALAAKASLTMTVTLSGTFSDGQVRELAYDSNWGSYMDEQGNYNRLFQFTRSATYSFTTTAFTWTAGQSARCNQYYANGLLLAEDSFNYIGLLPKGDPMMQIMAKQYHGLKMTKNNGLAFQQGSSSWYRLNPLALIVRLTYSNSQYGHTELYNPRNLTVNATRQSTGLVKVSLNIGHTSYSVLGSGINESNGVFVSSYNRTADYFFVELVSGTTRRDWNADIMVYDYLTL